MLNSVGLGNRKISALIASHGRSVVEKAILSAYDQTISKDNFEIIVVADEELPSLKKFENDPFIRIKYSDRKDPGGKWTEAIELSTGEILCFLDDDDEWVPEKLETVLDIFSRSTTLGYYHNGHISIDYDDAILPNYPELRHFYTINKLGSFSTFDSTLRRHNYQFLLSLGAPFNSSCISIRREIVTPYLEFLSKGMWMVDYFWFYANAVCDVDIMIDAQPLTRYRRRSDEAGVLLNNTGNDKLRKIIIYERYLSSHNTYIMMTINTPLEDYLRWVNSKIQLMLGLYKGFDSGTQQLNLTKTMLKYMPKRSVTGLLSSVMLAVAAVIGNVSEYALFKFLGLIDKLGLSLL